MADQKSSFCSLAVLPVVLPHDLLHASFSFGFFFVRLWQVLAFTPRFSGHSAACSEDSEKLAFMAEFSKPTKGAISTGCEIAKLGTYRFRQAWRQAPRHLKFQEKKCMSVHL